MSTLTTLTLFPIISAVIMYLFHVNDNNVHTIESITRHRRIHSSSPYFTAFYSFFITLTRCIILNSKNHILLLLTLYYPLISNAGTDIFPTTTIGSVQCHGGYVASTTFSFRIDYISFSYSPEANTANSIMFDTCSSSFDTVVYLYRDDVTIWTWLYEGDNDGDCDLQEQLIVNDLPSGDYIIGVTGSSASQYGDYDLYIFCGSNRFCGDSIEGNTSSSKVNDYYRIILSPPITMATQYTTGNTKPAILFSACDSDYDTIVYLYDSTHTYIDENDDSQDCPMYQSQLVLTDFTAGEYILVISGYQSAYGGYHIDIVCFEPDDICVEGATGAVNGVYTFDHYDSTDYGVVYYSSTLNLYTFPVLFTSTSYAWAISDAYTDTSVLQQCSLGNRATTGYVFNLDDCIGGWDTNPNMIVTNCQEVCSNGHYDVFIDGQYHYHHFDSVYRGNVYYCYYCQGSALYLYPFVDGNHYYWIFGTDYNVLLLEDYCNVTDIALSIGYYYVFKLDHCKDQWLSWDGSTSIQYAITTEICYVTRNPTSYPTKPPSNAPTDSPSESPTDSSDAPTVSPSIAPTNPPTNAPSMSPTFSPTVAPTIAPTPSTPTTSPTFTNKYIYVRQNGCDYGYCTDDTADYTNGCSDNVNEFDADLFSYCCEGPTPTPLPAVSTYLPTCKSVDYSWNCFNGIGGYPNTTGCALFNANGVYDIGIGVWDFPFQVRYDDNNVIIKGQSDIETVFNYIGDESVWITCVWPKCWIGIKDLSIASNRTATDDIMFFMPNGGTLYVENVIFDGNNYVNNQIDAFWKFIHALVTVEFHHCTFLNNDVFYEFTNGVHALFNNCTFYNNDIHLNGFNSNQAMIYIDGSTLLFEECTFISNTFNQRSLFTLLNNAQLNIFNSTFNANIAATSTAMFYASNSSIHIKQTVFINNTGFQSIFYIENGIALYVDAVVFQSNSDVDSIITTQASVLWSNDAFICVSDGIADIQIMSTSFSNNDVKYLLNINAHQMYIDDMTQFTDNNCTQSCILCTDASLNINGDTSTVFNQNDIFLVFDHQTPMDIKNSLCIRNENSITITPYFSCTNCNKQNTKVIFDECSNPYSFRSPVTFPILSINITASHSQIYDIPGENVNGLLSCFSNITFCEIHCTALVSCFASTIISDAIITNILCNESYSCQNSYIHAVPNNSHTVSSSLNIICDADSACQESTIEAIGHEHFQLDCVVTDSCIDSVVNISNTTTASIHCYEYAACDNMKIYTDNENTTFLFDQYSENVEIHNSMGYTEYNLECGADAVYITLDDVHNTVSSAVQYIFTDDIPNVFPYYGPCDSIQFICNGSSSQCSMWSSLTVPNVQPDFHEYYACYGPLLYKDISDQLCIGSTECGGPTQSPTLAPSLSPTSPTALPTNAPSTAPTSVPSMAPSTPPTHSPTHSPVSAPSGSPTAPPTNAPSFSPTFSPSIAPTMTPTTSPTYSPSTSPTFSPSMSPTTAPSSVPSTSPTVSPTMAPSFSPSTSPTLAPSLSPSIAPSVSPTLAPSRAPSISPTTSPSASPSFSPSIAPSIAPSVAPSPAPSTAPSVVPTITPTTSPTYSPSTSPTFSPSMSPTTAPSSVPSTSPTASPTMAPSFSPSTSPTLAPSLSPSIAPSVSPTLAPSTAPTISPSVAPTIDPSDAPSSAPTYSPSLAPSGEPSFSPTIAPTPQPTRQPTVTDGYDSYIPIQYGLLHVPNQDIVTIVHNPLNITNDLRYFIEFGYEYDENLVVHYDDFWLEILDINGISIADIDVNDVVTFSSSKDLLRLSSTLKCDEAICYHIIENYDQQTFEQFVTETIRNYFDTTHVNAANADDDELQFVVLETSSPLELHPAESKSTNYVFWTMSSLVILILIISIWAMVYNVYVCCKLPGFNIVDDGRWGALVIFALQFWDFVSDINLSIEILSRKDLTTDMFILISGVGSTTFIFVPYLANLLIAMRIKEIIKRNEAAKSWFQQNTAIFTILVVISGGCYPALAVVSSNIFGLRMTSCGLTQYELKQMGKIKILGTILLENLPQLVCQALYSLALGTITQTVALAFFASFLSVTASSLSYLIDRDASDTNVVQYYLTTTKLDTVIPYDQDHNDADDDDSDDLNLQTVAHLRPQPSTEIIYGDGVKQEEGDDDDDEQRPTHVQNTTFVQVPDYSPGDLDKAGHLAETSNDDVFDSFKNTQGNALPQTTYLNIPSKASNTFDDNEENASNDTQQAHPCLNVPNTSVTTSSRVNTTSPSNREAEGASAVEMTSPTQIPPLRTRIYSNASLTNNTDITEWEKKKFINNRGCTLGLAEHIAEVFAIPPKNIEVGYSNITKKGIITHIVHYVFEEDLETMEDKNLKVSAQMFTEQLCIALSKQLTDVFIKHFELQRGGFETNYSHKKRNRRLTMQTPAKQEIKHQKVMKRVSHQIKLSQNIEMSDLRKEIGFRKAMHDILESDEESLNGNEETKAKKALKRLFSARGVLKSNQKEKLNMISQLLLEGMDTDDDESKEYANETKGRFSSKGGSSDMEMLVEYIKETISSDDDEKSGGFSDPHIISSDDDRAPDFSTRL